jgi:hypothetical protein
MIILITISCSPKTDQDKFNNLNYAAKSVQGAITVGVNYVEYGALLQKYSTELLLLKNNNLIGYELDSYNLYKEALEIFIDARKIWEVKIESPKYNWIPKNNIFPLVGLTDIINKYGLKIDEIKDSSGKKWSTISSDSIQILWSKAELKISQAEKLILKNKHYSLWDKIFPKNAYKE